MALLNVNLWDLSIPRVIVLIWANSIFHTPGGPAQSTVPPTQSTVGAAQSTVELPETINMVHRVLFRPPHRVPGVKFFRACGAEPWTLYY